MFHQIITLRVRSETQRFELRLSTTIYWLLSAATFTVICRASNCPGLTILTRDLPTVVTPESLLQRVVGCSI